MTKCIPAATRETPFSGIKPNTGETIGTTSTPKCLSFIIAPASVKTLLRAMESHSSALSHVLALGQTQQHHLLRVCKAAPTGKRCLHQTISYEIMFSHSIGRKAEEERAEASLPFGRA